MTNKVHDETMQSCDICEREIPIDTVAESGLWKEISPSRDEAGMLCAACIADRIAVVRPGCCALRLVDAHPES